jgi:Right handed beta helix region
MDQAVAKKARTKASPFAYCISKHTTMYKSILLFLWTCLCLNAISAQTFVSGGIYNDVTWSLANSPYIVTGNIVVFPGKTLTIEPGVEVRVQGIGYPNNYGIGIEVRGNFVALGTLSAPITLKCDTSTTAPWTWHGIQLKTSQGATGIMDYVHLSNAYDGFAPDNSSQSDAMLYFHHCIFRDNKIAIRPISPATFSDCIFERNETTISPMSLLYRRLEIYDCDFTANTIAIGYVNDTVKMDHCNFWNNATALYTQNVGPVTNCVFDGNVTAADDVAYDFTDCSFTNNQFALKLFYKGSLTNCNVSNNGIGLDVATGVSITDNVISGNGVGMQIWTPVEPLTGNRICGSTQFHVKNMANENINLVGNCFCESDSTVLESKLFDGYDDITKGLFNYAIYDSTCTNVLQIVSKVTIPTGLQLSLAGKLQMFPVPAEDQLQVRLPEGESGGMIRLLSLQGQLLATQAASEVTMLDVSGFRAGVYLLEYRGTSTQILKWVKK